MKQVFLDSTGKVLVEEVLEPGRELPPGFLRVRVRSSLISSGTDRALIEGSGSGSMVKKMGRNPNLLLKVYDVAVKQGVQAARTAVLDKLSGRIALGYSCAGEVSACGEDTTGFKAGDRVACAGVGYANHAEVVVVPSNLVVALPPEVDFDQGAFVALGAIAQQGLRQAQASYGESLLVLGLGLVGQLVVQQAKGAGLQVAGADLAEERLAAARLSELRLAVNLNDPDAEARLLNSTGGVGFDAVVVTAADKSSEAFETAGRLVRDRGTISLVGVVGLPSASTFLIGKEMTVRGARSYGPGRYDARYEERGLDYPINHVRWTENRIMASFIRNIAHGAIRLDHLISKRSPVEEAAEAYRIVEEGAASTFAVVLNYPDGPRPSGRVDFSLNLRAPKSDRKFKLGVWGVGSFAREAHLPNLAAHRNVDLIGVGSGSGANATQAAKRYGAAAAFSEFDRLLGSGIQGLILSGRHNEHVRLATRALRSGVSVMVEKPLGITLKELQEAANVWSNSLSGLMVGHNRKFSPVIARLRAEIGQRNGPASLLYRVAAGPMKADHWMLDERIGGGRLVSELSHFVDTCMAVVAAPVSHVSAVYANREKSALQGTLVFADGSTAHIAYLPHGDKGVGKEYLEAHFDNRTLRMNDYLSLTEGQERTLIKHPHMEKGYREELERYLAMLADPRGPESIALARHDIEATHCMFELLLSADAGGAARKVEAL